MRIDPFRKAIIIVSIASAMTVPVHSAKALFGMDVGFITLKAVQYFQFWQGIRGELNKLSDRVNEEILKADKTQNPDGEPAFVEYWRDFIGESQFRGENVFRVQLATTSVCDYLKESLQSIYGVSDFEYDGREGLPPGYDTKAAEIRIHPYELEARCTLATIEGSGSNDGAGDRGSQDQFLDDWLQSSDPLGSYLELAKTQNNFYGAFLLADKEFKNQASFEREKDIYEVLANGGYRGVRDTGDGDQIGCIKDAQDRCVVLGKVQTPGNILAAGGEKTIEAEFDIITSRNEGVWQSVLGSLIEKFLNFNQATGVEGGDESLSIPIISALGVDPDSGYRVDFRDARNYTACIRDCDEDNPVKKPDGCSESGIGECLRCIGFGSEDEGFECTLWETVQCEGVTEAQNCEIEDENFEERSQCYETCNTRWLWPDGGVNEGGRCGVNFPQPQCTCEAIDSSVVYELVDEVFAAQAQIGAACAAGQNLSVCGELDLRGFGQLPGGLTGAAVIAYMNLLVSNLNALGLDASYEIFGEEPILAVSDGEKSEYYDVITSNGRAWNNEGKVICEPDRFGSGGSANGGDGSDGSGGGPGNL